MIISDKILYLRKKLGYTQEELAEQLNVSRQSISKWESAQSIPEISKIMAMAELFSVSTDYLLRDEIESLAEEPLSTAQADKGEVVTIEIANDFISAYAKHLRQIATGVFLCIFAAVPHLTLLALAESLLSEDVITAIGLCSTILLIAAAVGLFIYSGSLLEKYQYIMRGEFELSYNVSGILKEYRDLYLPQRTKNLILSVSLILLSAVSLMVSGVLFESERLHIMMAVLLLIAVAVAVFRLICGEGTKECYEILLFEGDFRKVTQKEKKKKETIEGIYWSLAVAIYLVWSFLTNDWHITWLVWPIAALLSTTLNLLWMNNEP